MAKWGTEKWGIDSWGSAGLALDMPIITAVSPTICDVKGGTVLAIFGTDFVSPIVEVLDGALQLIGTGYIFEDRLDVRLTKMLVGMPAAPVASYGLRVITPFGVSPVLPNAVTYKVFAEEAKVLRTRRLFSRAWRTGERII